MSDVEYAVEDGAAIITLNRPDKLNACTRSMMDELLACFDRVDADDKVRALIVTGAGRAFCAGSDISGGAAPLAGEGWRDGGGLLTLRIFQLTKPVIAAINGPAVGVGITMTLAMDMRLASETARFAFPFTRRGLVPEAASSWFLPRVVGIAQALDWMLSGRTFPAQEALAGRLVSEVVPPERLLDRAKERAAEIASQTAPVSVALTRQMLWRMLGADHPMEAHRVDSQFIAGLTGSPDLKEGINSFLEKRPPEFSMSPTEDMPSGYPWWEEPKFR